MSPDFRYHVASLSAVFLALGIGILLGTGFVGAKIVEKQTAQIMRLESKYADLYNKTTREKEQNDEALRLLMPNLVQGKLREQTVVLLDLGDSEAAEDAENALRRAGGTSLRLRLPNAAWLAIPEALRASRARRLAAALLQGGTALDEWRELGLIEGKPLEGALHTLVVAVDSHAPEVEEPERIGLLRTRDIPLVELLHQRGVRVAAVEEQATEPTLLHAWQAIGVATIDSMGHPVGQITLPFALTDEPGRYGLKPGAEHVFPESLTRESEPDVSPEPAPEASPAP